LEEAWCVKVPREMGERARRILGSLGELVESLKPRAEGGKVVYPVRSPERAVSGLAEAGVRAEPCRSAFEVYKRRKPPPAPRSYLVIGDILLFSGRPGEREELRRLAVELMASQPRIRTAYMKERVEGELRRPSLVHLAGERRTWTVHREHGILFYVDISKAYFNPRLAYEHHRVASLVGDGERVLDMFSGVGGFALHAASRARATVVASDLNPYAAAYAAVNVALNKKRLKGRVLVLRADARMLPGILEGGFDRIIMNHPTASLDYLDEACRLASTRAVIHAYTFALSRLEAVDAVYNALGRSRCGRVEVVGSRRVLEYSQEVSLFSVEIALGRGPNAATSSSSA
jgi:tRNA (guanine37-N1)-methyltransferase